MRLIALASTLAVLVVLPLLLGCAASVSTQEEVTVNAGGMTLDSGTSSGAADGYVYVPGPAAFRQEPIQVSSSPEPPPGYVPAVGAEVTISDAVVASRLTRTITTDAFGYYLFLGLPTGSYQVTIVAIVDGNPEQVTFSISVTAGSITHADGEPASANLRGFYAIFIDLPSKVDNWETEVRPRLTNVNSIDLGFNYVNSGAPAVITIYMSARGDLTPADFASSLPPNTTALISALSIPSGSGSFALGQVPVNLDQNAEDLIFDGRFWLYGLVTSAGTPSISLSSIQVRLDVTLEEEIL